MTVPTGDKWSYTYNVQGDLVEIQDPLNNKRRLEWDEAGITRSRLGLARGISPLMSTMRRETFGPWSTVGGNWPEAKCNLLGRRRKFVSPAACDDDSCATHSANSLNISTSPEL